MTASRGRRRGRARESGRNAEALAYTDMASMMSL